jgi:hypothetical protein
MTIQASVLIRERVLACVSVTLLFFWTNTSFAQDTEPRRWSQMPTGVNFFGVGYAYTEGDIYFDPLLRIEEATFDLQTVGISYIRSLAFMGKSARLDFVLPYSAGRWEGMIDAEYVSVRRRGPGDARARFSVLLYGGPAETPQEFAKTAKSNTVVGAAVSLTLPTGDYNSARLINLGSSRWVIRPQLGVTHRRGNWSGELTASAFIHTNNDNFWRGTELETDPLFAVQAHLVYTFRPGLWASLGTAYGWGGEATVDGEAKNNPTGNWLTSLSFGFPISRKQGFKVTWVRGRTQKPTGADIDSLALSYSVMF